jgi:hypothetical protein
MNATLVAALIRFALFPPDWATERTVWQDHYECEAHAWSLGEQAPRLEGHFGKCLLRRGWKWVEVLQKEEPLPPGVLPQEAAPR